MTISTPAISASGRGVLPRCPRFRVWQGRKPIRRGRCTGSSAFRPAAAIDIIARLIGQRLSERLGQPFVIENRPGAGSNIAVEAVVRSPRRRLHAAACRPTNAINATLYDKLTFDFIRDIAPVAGIMRVPQCHGGQSVGSGQDRSRIHRLCQGQSGQDQYGVVGQRHVGACRRRAVQDDDRHRHGPRALSRRGADAHRPAGRTGAGDVRPPARRRSSYIRAGKLRALGRDDHDALGTLPDLPTIGELRARLRGEHLVRRRRAQDHAASRSSTSSTWRSTPRSAIRRSRRSWRIFGGMVIPDTPAAFGKLHRRGNREVGEGGEVCRHLGGLIGDRTASFNIALASGRSAPPPRASRRRSRHSRSG